MSQPLQARVETFLNSMHFIGLTHQPTDNVISFCWEKENISIFLNKKNHEDLRDFFRGRKMKLVIYTPDETITRTSLVDTETADTIRLDSVKFITNNIILFAEANMPIDTVFTISMMCPKKDKDGSIIMCLHEYWVDKKQLKIHGYSLIDNRKLE
jgi:hypothetical protein